jgi:hypothetical protein
VKHLFYTILLVASIGAVAAIVDPSLLQHPLVQQGAALIGLELPHNTAESAEETSGEDQLAKFLEQYPSFANKSNSATVPTTNVPMVVIPESAPPPMPPVYAPPIVSPTLVAAPAASVAPAEPAYANNNTNWDGAAATPIYAPPAMEYHPPSDWSGAAQPYQEPTYPPQQSAYTAVQQEDVFPVLQQDTSGFARTNYVPPPMPPVQPPPPIHSPPSATLQTPAALIEDVPVYGTEMAARVGTQVILMGDILPKLRRAALRVVSENIKRMSEDERTNVPRQEIEQFINMFAESHYPEVLQEQIMFALVYNDYDLSQDKASKNMFNERMGDEFDRAEVPELMKEFSVENHAALKRYLEDRLGSSLEKEKRLWIREQIVRQWIHMSIQRATGECTHDEMKDFYEKNETMFTSATQARWQEMVVLLSRHNTEQEAWNKIRWMGNQVLGGAPFEEITKANSDGFTASNGGIWDWTAKGNLTSEVLEQAIFSQPIGNLSPAIIRSDKGLHIVRVLERQEAKVVPFLEAQVTIREKIKNLRTQRYQEEYLTNLRNRIPVEIVKDRIDFNVHTPRTAGNMR